MNVFEKKILPLYPFFLSTRTHSAGREAAWSPGDNINTGGRASEVPILFPPLSTLVMVSWLCLHLSEPQLLLREHGRKLELSLCGDNEGKLS